MRCKSLVLALTALGGIASAQPGPPPQPPPPPVDTTTTTTTTVDVAPIDQQPQPQPQPQPVQQVETTSVAGRPDGMSIALGFGYALPTSLQTPNITSARLRLASGLTFEPLVQISNETTDEEMSDGMGGTIETTDKHTTFQLAVLARFQMVSRGKVDLELLGSAGFTNDKVNPDGDFNTTTQNIFGVGWGVAVGYWFSEHWNLSMNVTNDLFSYTQTKRQTGPGGMAFKEGTTEIGVIFEPSVFMMLHLYN